MIRACVEVHRILGPGYLESIYERALAVELKAVETLLDVHKVQVRSYLKAREERLALLINFNSPLLLKGVRRIIWTP